MSDAELTRTIKAALRKHFPECKFAVTRGGTKIEWLDTGPEVAAVEDTIFAAGLAKAQQGHDGKRWLRIESAHSNSIYFDRYNAAARAANQQDSERRRQESEARTEQIKGELSAAWQGRRTALGALHYHPPQPDASELQPAIDAFEVLRERAEAVVAIEGERQRRPSWAPPLVLDGELLELCRTLGYLPADGPPIARLWAMYADPKKSRTVLRERVSSLPLSGIACRGFQLFAGEERGTTSNLLFEAQRNADGDWRFGPAPASAYLYHYYPSNEWSRLTQHRLEIEDRLAHANAFPADEVRLAQLTRQIAELDAREFTKAETQRTTAQQRTRMLQLARHRVLSFVGAPDAQMQSAARLWGHCWNCGRELTDPISLERGIGPDCYQHLRDFIQAYAAEPIEDLMLYSGMPEEFIRAVIDEMPTSA